jgi:hypothetical protein
VSPHLAVEALLDRDSADQLRAAPIHHHVGGHAVAGAAGENGRSFVDAVTVEVTQRHFVQDDLALTLRDARQSALLQHSSGVTAHGRDRCAAEDSFGQRRHAGRSRSRRG